jgi:hypothetical protein
MCVGMNLNSENICMTTILRQSVMVALLSLFPAFSSLSQAPFQSQSPEADGEFSEEIYIRTDRDIYIAGEQVCLKIFCLSRLTRQTSGISRVAYVNLLDRDNNPVISLKAKISGMSGTASFALPDTLGTGNYFIAGSTRWMQNFSPELFSYKTIAVVNPFRSTDSMRVTSEDGNADQVTFFPEGGAVIPGTVNVIGFRCLDAGMGPVSFSGIVSDGSDSILCHIRSDAYGYGIIRTEVPLDGKLYLRSLDDDTEIMISELPSASDSAVAIAVMDDTEQSVFRVRLNRGPGFSPGKKALRLWYSPVSTPPILLADNPQAEKEIIVRHDALPEGLAYISLADEKGEVITGRWLYNSHKSTIHIRVGSDRGSYSPRDKVTITVNAEDSSGTPLKGDLLLSVVRRQSLAGHEATGGYGLQISGLPGANASCGIYGNNDRLLFFEYSPSAPGNEGRRQFLLPEPDGHIISGAIMKTGTGEPLAESDIVFSFVGRKALCRFATTDTNGRFMFVSTEEGIRELVIQPVASDTVGYYVELDDPFPGTFSKNAPLELSIDTGILDMIDKSVISMQVKRVYDPLTGYATAAEEKDEGNDFYGEPEYVTDMSAFIQLTTLGEALKELVQGAVTTTQKGKAVIKTVRKYKDMVEEGDPLVIVDGVPVPDHEKVLGIPGDKIAEIKVVNDKYFVAGFVLGGVIDIKTYEGDLSVIRFDKPVFRQEYHGLTAGKDFTSPDYTLQDRKESRVPDFRNTLHWDPELETDSNGRAVAEFFASDEPGDYLILVEGFNSGGVFMRGTGHLIIEKAGNESQSAR